VLANRWKCAERVVREKRESLGIPSMTMAERVWTDEELALLGTMPDTELAPQLDLPLATVRRQRSALGIAPFQSREKYQWSASALRRLGKVKDAELALELGLSPQFVAGKRAELGIAPLPHGRIWIKKELRLPAIS
jgi:hypothetical protein